MASKSDQQLDQDKAMKKPPYDPHIMRMLLEESGGADTAISEMNVIPFIDICLVLLIIVLMSSAFAYQLFVFENPTAKTLQTITVLKKDGTANVIRVRMTAKKRFEVNGKVTSFEQLGRAIRSLSQQGYSALEFLASEQMDSQSAVSALEAIRKADKHMKVHLNTFKEKE